MEVCRNSSVEIARAQLRHHRRHNKQIHTARSRISESQKGRHDLAQQLIALRESAGQRRHHAGRRAHHLPGHAPDRREHHRAHRRLPLLPPRAISQGAAQTVRRNQKRVRTAAEQRQVGAAEVSAGVHQGKPASQAAHADSEQGVDEGRRRAQLQDPQRHVYADRDAFVQFARGAFRRGAQVRAGTLADARACGRCGELRQYSVWVRAARLFGQGSGRDSSQHAVG